MSEELTPGTLKRGEVHPAAHSAMDYVQHFLIENVGQAMVILESFASTAIEGNRLSEVCHETLKRIIAGEPVSDRYLLGLSWTLMEMESMRIAGDKEDKKTEEK